MIVCRNRIAKCRGEPPENPRKPLENHGENIQVAQKKLGGRLEF